MTDPSFYSLKEVLAQIEARTAQRLDRIEGKLDRKADHSEVMELARRIAKIEANALDEQDAAALRKIDLARLIAQVEELSVRTQELGEKALTVDNVKATIGQVLQESEARGWTTRERVMGLILFGITLASFVLNLVQSG